MCRLSAPNRVRTIPLIVAIGLLPFASQSLHGEVIRIDTISRTDVLGGKSFGLAGPYELIVGKVYYAIDPHHPLNHVIVDLDRAPRNSQGLVEFSGDLRILKPKDPRRGNNSLIYHVANRGRPGLPGRSRTVDVPEIGDDFLMRHGFTIVLSGWQFDLPDREGLLRLEAPIPLQNAKPIEGLVRRDFVLYEREFSQSLGHLTMVPYPAIDPDSPENVLSVRDDEEAERQIIPRDEWSFARVEGDRIIPDSGHVYLRTGFEPGRIYEVIWRSHNPPVAGVQLAAVRDLISHFKYDPGAIVTAERAYAFGTSQSGRYLREFIYGGWNADEHNRKVFDGIIPNVAAQGNQGFNHRFSQPSAGNFPFLYSFFSPTNLFPFTDIEQTDPETGETDGMLAIYSTNPDVLPNIFYVNASNEYWGRSAAVTHTSVDGTEDVRIPQNVRHYAIAGTQHGPASFPPVRTRGAYRSNSTDFIWIHRALLIAMDRWVRDGALPPESSYPRISDGTLVPVADLNFPAIPGVDLPGSVPASYRVDFGPRFKSEGIIDWEPPRVGKPFPVLQAQVDRDGNELGGIRLPDVSVPLATLTGWNLRAPETGNPTKVAGLLGSYIPFPRTQAERERTGDPRLSIEERYDDRAHFMGMYTEAALKLIDEGYLLAEDLAAILEQARRHWDWATSRLQ